MLTITFMNAFEDYTISSHIYQVELFIGRIHTDLIEFRIAYDVVDVSICKQVYVEMQWQRSKRLLIKKNIYIYGPFFNAIKTNLCLLTGSYWAIFGYHTWYCYRKFGHSLYINFISTIASAHQFWALRKFKTESRFSGFHSTRGGHSTSRRYESKTQSNL